MAWTVTRAELRAYWGSMPPATIAGRTRSLTHCPLARYLARHRRSLRADLERGDVPEWVYWFLRQIDTIRGPVPAGRALAVLTRIEALEALEERRADVEKPLATPRPLGRMVPARVGLPTASPVLFDPGAPGALDGGVGRHSARHADS